MYVLIISRGYPSQKYKMNGIFEFDQARALKSAGHKVIYAAIDVRSIRRWRSWGIEKKKIDNIDVYAINIPVGRVPNRVLQKLSVLGLNILYNKIQKEQGRPDVLHAHFTRLGYTALQLKKKIKIPLVVTEHLSSIMKPTINCQLFRIASITYKSADALIAVSPNFRDIINKRFNTKAKYIPNIVDTRLFSYSLSENDDIFRFVSIGNLIPSKRMDLIIEAFAKTFKDNPKVTLSIFGEGPERINLENIIIKHNISHQVKLMGLKARREIAEFLKRSDCFVLPSQFETFGVAYIEALASGLPVIATKCGGPECFINEKNGLLIDIDNLEELSSAMLSMKDNINNYNRNLISRFITDQFAPKEVANRLTRLYNYVVNSNLTERDN